MLRDVRVEVAFTTDPDTATPAWQDVSSYARVDKGIGIRRGRSGPFGEVQPGTCDLVLDNSDGRFTPGLSSGPYSPNVKPGRRLRVYVAGTMKNFVGNSTMETDIVGWSGGGSVPPALAQSSAQAWQGTQSLRVTWGTGGVLPGIANEVSGLTIGRTYTLSAYVYVPTGDPLCLVVVAGVGFGSANANRNMWERITYTFVATSTTHTIGVWPATAPTSGDLVYVDGVQVEEGSTASTFTSSGPVTYPRFDGVVESWTPVWPSQQQSLVQVRCGDRLRRMAAGRTLRAMLVEEHLNAGVVGYWPLAETQATTTTAGDWSDTSGQCVLTRGQRGTGGTLAWGAGTGPGTDDLSAPIFTRVDASNGKFLAGRLVNNLAGTAATLMCFFNVGTAQVTTMAQLLDEYLARLVLRVTAAGKLEAEVWDPFVGVRANVVSAATVSDSATRHAAATLSASGGTVTLTLYLNGVSVGTDTYSGDFIYAFNQAAGGGGTNVELFHGTLAHLAVANSALSAGTILRIYEAGNDGHQGERSDQRIDRLADYLDVPAGSRSLEVGALASMSQQRIDGRTAFDCMKDVARSENGLLFCGRDYELVFHSRSHRYNQTASFTTPHQKVTGGAVQFVVDDQLLATAGNDVTVSRPGGPTQRVVNAASTAAYGTFSSSVEILTTDDAEALSAGQWRVSRFGEPKVRADDVTVDLYSLNDDTLAASWLTAELGDRFTITGLIATMPGSSVDLVIEGYAERIGVGGHTLQVNTTSAYDDAAWVLDSSTFSQLDSTTRLAY